MEARLVKVLLRCVQSENERFSVSASLNDFVLDYGAKVGERKGKSIYISTSQKQVIRELLNSEGVNADTSPEAWDGLTRAEALLLGHNEKFANEPVKRRRVAMKALQPSMPLILNGRPIFLPVRCHAEVDYDELDDMTQHDWLVVVENWECFNDIHIAATSLTFPGKNPLILWRGDKDSVRSDSLLAVLNSLRQPVAAFVDYDPSGMIIARSLPRLGMVVAPSPVDLAKMMQSGLVDRYMDQIAGCQGALEKMDISCISPIWEVIRSAGRALPQEKFIFTDK